MTRRPPFSLLRCDRNVRRMSVSRIQMRALRGDAAGLPFVHIVPIDREVEWKGPAGAGSASFSGNVQ